MFSILNSKSKRLLRLLRYSFIFQNQSTNCYNPIHPLTENPEQENNMNTLKTMTLALLLVLISVAGLRAEEVSLEQFADEFFTAMQAQDADKIVELLINHRNILEQFQEMLTRAGEDELAEFVGELRQALSGGSSNPTLELDRLQEEGEKSYDAADYPTALEKWQTGLEKARELGDKSYISQFLGNIGLVYDNLGQYENALSHHQQVLEVYRELNDERNESAALSNIGVVYQNLGQYEKALTSYQQALVIDREIKDRRGEGADLTNIGNVYQSLGQYEKALTYYQQALVIDREIKDRRGEGGDLSNIGNVYLNLDQYGKALTYYQQALDIHREIKDRRGEGADLSNIGNVYLNLGQDEKALTYYQQALDIHREIKDRREEGSNLSNIGAVYKYLGKYQQAKVAFQDSVAILKKLASGNPWIALRGLASTEAKLNQPDLAIQHYEQALDNIESLRAGITAKAHKISFMRDKIGVYDELIALLQSLHSDAPKKGYDRKALEIFERKQGRVFLEEMGQSGARRFAALDNDIMQAEQELTDKSQQLSKQPLHSPERAALEQEFAQLAQRLKTQYPKYYALKYPQPATLTALQNEVLQKGDMMLVYGVIPEWKGTELESTTILWIIGKNKFQMFTLKLSEQQLDKFINDETQGLRHLIINRLPVFEAASHDIYNQLLPEAARQLITGADTLYIVPTGPLYGLPFEALVTNDDTSRYLIQDYAIVYLSSASLLKNLREEEINSAPKPFLAFADPVYPKCKVPEVPKDKTAKKSLSDLRTQTYLKAMGGCFTPLPQTADEVRDIADLLEADKTTDLYLQERASRSQVFALNEQQRLDDYRYIMFSVHGVLLKPKNEIEQSALVLSNPTTEGYLTMADAFALQLNAKLVNLSACNSGRGGNIRGEGIRGLTRAFMYAGTPATSVTLWSVNLLSAKVLSTELYRHLKANLEKGEAQKLAHALRQVKLNMINRKTGLADYSAPFHWAPFVVYGDGQ